MKYSINSYAKALAGAIQFSNHNSQIGENFLSVLKKNRDENYAKKIIEETEKILRQRDNSKKFVITLARSSDKNPKELLKDILTENDSCEVKLKPELIAGMTIKINDNFYFDGSLKGKLDKLFNY
jgi:F0F1-type ATP synthase delta subunit